MTTTAQSIIQRAQTTLQDIEGVRHPATELVGYLNDGQRALINVRNDVGATTVAFIPAVGARQTVPANALALIDVLRNTNGTQRAVRKVDMVTMDATARDWTSGQTSKVATNFMFDPDRDPRTFWVYPPAATGASLDLLIAAYPTDVPAPSGAAYTTVTGSISVQDHWDNALLSYVLARAYMKDSEFAGNAQLSSTHMTSFLSQAGVKPITSPKA